MNDDATMPVGDDTTAPAEEPMTEAPATESAPAEMPAEETAEPAEEAPMA